MNAVVSARKTAVVTGVFFIVAAIAVIAGLLLYSPVLKAGCIVGSGADARVFLGAFAEVITAMAVIGTGVSLFPIVKRQNEGIALGYVVGRLPEATVIVVGAISLVSVVTLRQDLAATASANAASLVPVGRSLVAIHDWSFLFGPGFAIGVNTLMLAYLMSRSRLVPRFIAVLGLVGGPIIFASSTAVLFGLYEQVSVWGPIAAIPVTAWEMRLAVYLIVKGFGASGLQQLGFMPAPTNELQQAKELKRAT